MEASARFGGGVYPWPHNPAFLEPTKSDVKPQHGFKALLASEPGSIAFGSDLQLDYRDEEGNQGGACSPRYSALRREAFQATPVPLHVSVICVPEVHTDNPPWSLFHLMIFSSSLTQSRLLARPSSRLGLLVGERRRLSERN
eukprot:2273074-Amphidinium_carterae.1